MQRFIRYAGQQQNQQQNEQQQQNQQQQYNVADKRAKQSNADAEKPLDISRVKVSSINVSTASKVQNSQ